MEAPKNSLKIVTGLIILAMGGYLVQKKYEFNIGLELFIIVLIAVLGIISLFEEIKKAKDEKDGFATEDELSTIIKYKSGYYAFLGSMYLWLAIFMFNSKFPDIETMLGGGILLSALISWIAKIVVKVQLRGK